MNTLADRIAARFRMAGGYDGPHIWIEDIYLQVWVGMDSYGRVHHVVGDITGAEKLLDKFRQKLVSAQLDLAERGVGIRDISDIYVDGLPGGRNRMMLNFTVKAQGTWGDDQQDALMAYVPHLRVKKPG